MELYFGVFFLFLCCLISTFLCILSQTKVNIDWFSCEYIYKLFTFNDWLNLFPDFCNFFNIFFSVVKANLCVLHTFINKAIPGGLHDSVLMLAHPQQ